MNNFHILQEHNPLAAAAVLRYLLDELKAEDDLESGELLDDAVLATAEDNVEPSRDVPPDAEGGCDAIQLGALKTEAQLEAQWLWSDAETPSADAEFHDVPLTQGERRDIYVGDDEHRVAEESLAAIAKDPFIFQSDGRLVRIVQDVVLPGKLQAPRQRVVNLAPASLRELLSKHARFWEWRGKQKGWVPSAPPKMLMSAILSRTTLVPVRVLVGTAETAVLTATGEVVALAGYDARTCLFIAGAEPPPIAATPSRADALKARDSILDLVEDFPFASERDVAAFVAAVMTPLTRYAHQGSTPIIAIESSAPGVGKTLLARILSWISLGREVSSTALRMGRSGSAKFVPAPDEGLVWVDNLSSDDAARAVEVTLQTAGSCRASPIWMLVGDNLQLERATLSRRVLRVRLEPSEDVSGRKDDFAYRQLMMLVQETRAELTSAVLTILRAYACAGFPPVALVPWGGFEAWSDLVRSAIVWAGMADPRAATQAEWAEDRATDAGQALLAAWEAACDVLGLADLSAADALRFTREGARQGKHREDVSMALRDAIEEMCHVEHCAVTAGCLGTALRGLRGKIFGERFFQRTPYTGRNRWRVEKLAPGGRGGRGGRPPER